MPLRFEIEVMPDAIGSVFGAIGGPNMAIEGLYMDIYMVIGGSHMDIYVTIGGPYMGIIIHIIHI